MKTPTLVLTLALLTACSSPSGDANAPATRQETPAEASASPTEATSTEAMTTPETASAATTVSASGKVEAIDVAAKTITIAHGPVDELKWPAMTMTFKAPDVDLASLKEGDHVEFEFAASGMESTITKITKH